MSAVVVGQAGVAMESAWKAAAAACVEVIDGVHTYVAPETPEQWFRALRAAFAAAAAAPQGGGVDGRTLAKARDAWQCSDEGRMLANDINGPVGGQYLRNRLEVAFCAGYEAALTAQPRTDAALAQQPAAVDGSLLRELRWHEVERLLRRYAAQHDKTSPRMAQMMELGARAVAALAGQQQGGA